MTDPKISKASPSVPVYKAPVVKAPAAPPATHGETKAAVATDAHSKTAAAPAHDDGGHFAWGQGPSKAEIQQQRQAVVNKLARFTEVDNAPDLNIAAASQALIGTMGNPKNALGLVIAARGGEGDTVLQPEEQLVALLAVTHDLGLKAPPSQAQLRDMDHFLNSFSAIHEEGAFAPARGDGYFKQTLKTMGRESLAVGGVAIVAGYSGLKAVSQITGVDALGMVSGRYSGNGERTSKTDFNELYYGLSGVFHGAFDTGADR